ncbi:MAG TPA: site-specific DNA-methyltransferase [Bacilli bacterium]|nr:site-specific DNA-methyltransferase [Bacilli bacterium]
MRKKVIYEHLGKTLESYHKYDLSDEKYMELVEQYYKKPKLDDVIKNIDTLKNGGTAMTQVDRYFFKEIYSKVRLYHSKWSISEVFEHKGLLGYFYAKTLLNDKIFNKTDIQNIETAMRLGGKGVCLKPTMFPVKTVDYILKRYNVKNYHDYCCGWGDRLTSAMKNEVNYYGTDVNYELVEKLIEYKDLWQPNSKVDIRCQGSEFLVDEWIGKMDLSFSSPPYFNLEDYKIGNQSYKEGITYEQWLENYMKPTIENSVSYLNKDGKFAINVNNFDKYELKKDVYNICISLGLIHLEDIKLKNIERTNSKGNLNDNSEIIMVFNKGENKNETK